MIDRLAIYLFPNNFEIDLYSSFSVPASTAFDQKIGISLQNLIFSTNLQTFIQGVVFFSQL